MSNESKPYLLFSLNSSLYGIEAFLVQEIFFLPELTPITEAPEDIVGIVNLRGKILPVMDLNIRLRHDSQQYSTNHSVIVLAWQDIQVGLIVNEVHQVAMVSQQDITKKLSYGRKKELDADNNFVAGIAQIETDLVMLLNHEKLFSYAEDITNNQLTVQTNGKARQFCPNATAEERVIFRDRAENLMRVSNSEDFAGLTPLAVVGLNGEYFGLDLKIVREFTDIRKITPIPCCPNYIVGNMNLRGEILTLVDIRTVLNLSTPEVNNVSKAMVVNVDDLVVGIAIDQVFDVMYLKPSDIMSVPAAVHSSNDEYLRGTALYSEKIMGILELPKILRQGVLTVNEEV